MKSFFKAIKLILFLNCEQSAQLTSESFDRQLSRCERIAVWIHQAICRKSHRLATQLKMLDEKVEQVRDFLTNAPEPYELSQEAKDRIRGRIRDQSEQA
jgi:hypothetical protein